MPAALWLPLRARPSPACHMNGGQVPSILRNVTPGQYPLKESLTQKGKRGTRREEKRIIGSVWLYNLYM